MSKQTALDWFWDKMKSHFEHDGDLLETATFTFAIAKEKEKEQIIEAYDSGQQVPPFIYSEKYYNETFKNDQ